jgi:predicted metalloprotease with PDZ domain
MSKKLLVFTLIYLFFVSNHKAQEANNSYQYQINLTTIKNDILSVELISPINVQEKELLYHFPASTPNTYQIFDFGRFVQNLKAFDKKGRELSTERLDQNTWRIKAEKRLYKISYDIEDTWDSRQPNPVFEAAGTAFETNKFFLLNHGACFGFFKGKEKLPFVVSIDRPSTLHPNTSLNRILGDYDTDIYRAESYADLVDAPLIYCVVDTASFPVGYSKIEVMVYSPNQKVTAKEIVKKIRPLIEAQTHYLGGILPTNRYIFMLHLSPTGYLTGQVGALEHARCAVFCLIEDSAEKIAKQVVNQAAHEFFHIIVPMYIHSEEVHNFDFINPKMSQHLWLYEGVVDYMAQHVQAKYGLINDEKLLNVFNDKTKLALGKYNDTFPLTKMSANCLIEPYKKSYNGVFSRGFMAVTCMDLLLLSQSEGEYGLINLIRDLSSSYGQDKSFKDKDLFDKIYEIVQQNSVINDISPLKIFVEKHIAGIEKINFNEYFEPFGLQFFDELTMTEISPLGGLDNSVLKSDSLEQYYIAKPERMDDFGRLLGFKQNDIILEWNSSIFNTKTVYSFLISYKESAKENDLITIKILRKDEKGDLIPKTLSAVLTKISIKRRNQFKFVAEANPQQVKMRKIWLGE